jgi:hypothetical protein
LELVRTLPKSVSPDETEVELRWIATISGGALGFSRGTGLVCTGRGTLVVAGWAVGCGGRLGAAETAGYGDDRASRLGTALEAALGAAAGVAIDAGIWLRCAGGCDRLQPATASKPAKKQSKGRRDTADGHSRRALRFRLEAGPGVSNAERLAL